MCSALSANLAAQGQLRELSIEGRQGERKRDKEREREREADTTLTLTLTGPVCSKTMCSTLSASLGVQQSAQQDTKVREELCALTMLSLLFLSVLFLPVAIRAALIGALIGEQK